MGYLKKLIVLIFKIENLRILKTFVKVVFYKKQNLHIIGDSHSYVIDYINSNKLLDEYIYVMPVEAATVQGVVNPNSITDAFKYFKRYIFWNIRKNDYLGIILGEVDCGFVMWYRMQKYNVSIEEQLKITLQKYEEFIQFIFSKGIKNIILFSIPLPTIKDNQTHGNVANLRNEISISQERRTNLTIEFNHNLQQLAIKYYCDYVDFSKDIISSKTGLIEDKFLNKNLLDHHMDNKEFSKILVPYLKKYIKGRK